MTILHPTNEFRDRYVAPEMSAFTSATICDMSGVRKSWLTSFILNSALLVTMDDDSWRTFFNFLRRTEAAFRAYEAAREMTGAHLANPDPNAVSDYIEAIDHWEIFLSLACQAWNLLVRGQRDVLGSQDGSALLRLSRLYNVTKHVDGAIKRRRPRQFPSNGTLPLWLKNDGLHSVEDTLSFEEIAEMLTELALWADAAQNPLTMRETITTAYGIAGSVPAENTDS